MVHTPSMTALARWSCVNDNVATVHRVQKILSCIFCRICTVMLFFCDSNKQILLAQNIRSNIEHRATVLQSYISSLQVRTDTKLSLLLGALLGLSVVAAIAAFPGKPIDYTGVGEPMIRGFRILSSLQHWFKSEPPPKSFRLTVFRLLPIGFTGIVGWPSDSYTALRIM